MAVRQPSFDREDVENAEECLIEENLNLVPQVVCQIAAGLPRFVDRDGMVGAGALGLVEAAKRFEAERGVPFGSFAVRRIRGSILDFIRSTDWAPRSVRQVGRDIAAAEQELAGRLSRFPTNDEIAAALGISQDELRSHRARAHRSIVLALDASARGIHDGGGTFEFLETLADDRVPLPSAEIERCELLSYLHDAIVLLPERHRQVIMGYFFENKTSQDLARFLHVTESRISQLRSEAIDMLKDALHAQYEDRGRPHEAESRSEQRLRQYVEAVGHARNWRSRIDLAESPVRS